MFDYILSLGGTVFVPIIMIVIGLIFRIPWLQAIKAGVTVGIGFVGMGLVIVMAIDSLSPPIKVMIERFGLALHVFDVGAGPASGVGYATAIGAMIIPVIFLLNVTMLVTRLTNDIQQIQNVLMMGLRMAMRAPGMFIGALIMAFMMNLPCGAIVKNGRLDGKTGTEHRRAGRYFDTARLRFQFSTAFRST